MVNMNSRWNWPLRLTSMIAIVTLVAGCIGSTAGQMTLPADTHSKSIYFVERHAKDGRNLAETIAERMRARGLNATSGTTADPKRPHDYVVQYTDKWMWDMRMYLADLRIELRDPKDQSIVGFGQSSQSSLKAMGKSHVDVIDAALNELFKPR